MVSATFLLGHRPGKNSSIHFKQGKKWKRQGNPMATTV